MVEDAERYATEDKAKLEEAETRQQGRQPDLPDGEDAQGQRRQDPPADKEAVERALRT